MNQVRFACMGSEVTLALVDPAPGAASALARAEAICREVARTCTRFDPASPLSRANAAPDQWHTVPRATALAVAAAADAYRATAGRFDPRVLQVLLSWGYDRTLPFEVGAVTRAGVPAVVPTTEWRPAVVDDGGWRVHLGGHPIDLGGIGKGLAVRWAAAALAGASAGSLVDAGGDLVVSGRARDGQWRIGVEDPAGGTEPVLVLALTEEACATSSVRRGRWLVGDRPVHHLVDPRTGDPGGAGLAAVTAVHPDPAWAEVRAKELFLAGADGVAARASELALPVAWVTSDGTVGVSADLEPRVLWRRQS